MTDYYVNPSTGSDANDGLSGAAPLKSIEYAVENKAVSGDTILLHGSFSAAVGIFKNGTDYSIKSSFTGKITIMPVPLNTAEIDLPANTSSNGLFAIVGEYEFRQLKFKNTSVTTKYLFRGANDGNKLSLYNCYFDHGGAAMALYLRFSTAGTSFSIKAWNCTFKNISGAGGIGVFSGTNGTNYTAEYDICGCLFHNTAYVINATATDVFNLVFARNTVVSLNVSSLFYNIGNGGYRDIKNNVFYGDPTVFYKILYADVAPDMAKWSVEGNMFFIPILIDPNGDIWRMVSAKNDIFTINETNFYIEPGFVNYGVGNFRLADNSKIIGRGVNITTGPETDMDGIAFGSLDVGCYSNPRREVIFPSINVECVAFTVDSISEGLGNRALETNYLSPINPVGTGLLGAGNGGASGISAKWHVDRIALTWSPEFIVFSVFGNNFLASSNSPSNLTYDEAAEDLKIAIKKCLYWGITPIVLGMAGVCSADTTIQVEKPTALNNALLRMAGVQGTHIIPLLERMRENPNWNLSEASGGYYGTTGLAGNVHPANAGYDFILTIVKEVLDSIAANNEIKRSPGSIQIVFEVES